MLPALPTGYSIAPLNTPGWSVLFEMAVNVVYGAIRRWLTTPLLAALVAVSGAALVPLILRRGTLDAGFLWADVPVTVVRVTFFFFAGVLLLRLPRPATRENNVAILLPLAAVLLLARADHSAARDLLRAILIFPVLIWLGLWLQPGPRLAGLFRFGGRISYALYAVHRSIWHFAAPSLAKRIGGDLARKLTAAALLAVLVALSDRLDRFYDAPARSWATRWITRHTTRRTLRRDLLREPAASAP